MAITRRKLLGMLTTLPLLAAGVKASRSDEPEDSPLAPEEEWEVGFRPGADGLLVSVWKRGRMAVSRGAERLRLTEIKTNGWRTFRGKYGTAIELRRIGRGRIEVDYFVIVTPNGPRVEDRDYLSVASLI